MIYSGATQGYDPYVRLVRASKLRTPDNENFVTFYVTYARNEIRRYEYVFWFSY